VPHGNKMFSPLSWRVSQGAIGLVGYCFLGPRRFDYHAEFFLTGCIRSGGTFSPKDGFLPSCCFPAEMQCSRCRNWFDTGLGAPIGTLLA
jgi:hypothetical protein